MKFMKKILVFLLTAACLFGVTLTACGDKPDEAGAPEIPADAKVLVAYFSWSSNTERIAEYIAEKTDGVLYEIEPATPYPTDYTRCTEVALEERDSDARPEIKNPIDISQFDTVFIGYPIWWHTAPMIIGTFLESNDMTGKSVYPFSQSASMNTEQFATSMEFVRGCAGAATVHDGLFARSTNTATIDAYLTANGFTD